MPMVAELVFYAVGPGELPESENERHERVPKDHARGTLLPVAPVGDEDPLLHDAETAPFREAPDQLYVVELEGRVEAIAVPKDVSLDGYAGPGPRRNQMLKRPREQVEENVETLYHVRGAVGKIQGTGDVELAALEV